MVLTFWFNLTLRDWREDVGVYAITPKSRAGERGRHMWLGEDRGLERKTMMKIDKRLVFQTALCDVLLFFSKKIDLSEETGYWIGYKVWRVALVVSARQRGRQNAVAISMQGSWKCLE